jgi:hypothetical protein
VNQFGFSDGISLDFTSLLDKAFWQMHRREKVSKSKSHGNARRENEIETSRKERKKEFKIRLLITKKKAN